MQVVRLKAQNKANVGLNPKNNTIYLSKPSGGIPYVELSSVACEDWYKNSHIKILSGIYTGPRPTSIRVRDHYPHSIGTAWCRLSNLMNAELTWPFYATPRVNVVCSTFPITTTDTDKEFISETFKDNLSALKETCFYGARNTLITVGDIEVANSMRYDTIEPLAPEEDTANYYGDRIATAGVVYPYGTIPSGWESADINYSEQTWEVEITLNQFTLFEGTANQQTHNYWKPYHATSYPKGLNYDPRLHAIEVDITSTYEGKTIHGKRWYYIWHVPQCWPAIKAPKITVNTGSYSGPFDGPNSCPGAYPTYNYNTGYTASGGDAQIETMGSDINYKNILYDLYPVIPISTSDELLLQPSNNCLDSEGNHWVTDTYGSSTGWKIKKYSSDLTYLATYPISGVKYVTKYSDSIFCGCYYSVKKLDLDGNTLLSFGSSGSGDGQFNDVPRLFVDGTYIYTLINTKIQIFDMDGNFIEKITVPTGLGYDYFVDFDMDESGNYYIISRDSAWEHYYISIFDNDFNLTINFEILSILDTNSVNYYDGKIYITVWDSLRLDKVEIYDTSGTKLDSYEYGIGGYSMFIDRSTGYMYLKESTGIVTALNQSYEEMFSLGLPDSSVKYVERNCKNYGVWDLAQIKAAYAVVTPNNFDPTDSATYAEMTEYTGEDFAGITLTSGGLLKFKNLYKNKAHYIYLKVDFSPMGSIDTQYSYWSWLISSYGCSSGYGHQRNYAWCTLAPSCTENPAGTATQYCNQTFSFDQVIEGEETVSISLNDFDSGEDLATCTTKFFWLGSNNSIYPYCLASDGRTKAWIACGVSGIKKDYQNIDDAVNVNVIGTPTALNYLERYGNYGFDYSVINLINRAIKDGTVLTTGFQTTYSPERIPS